MERIFDSPNTLVHYSNPVLITKRTEKPSTSKFLALTSAAESAPIASRKITLASEKARETEEILNYILPPIEWEEQGQLWRQQVSSDPATRLDVLKLAEQLEMRLQQRQARETGICPVRRELFTQCFDEIIRQVTVNCAERGLLLLRVRDEIRMTTDAYQALYESSIAFGMRKALQAEQGKSDMQESIERLTSRNADLEKNVSELRAKAEQIERRAAELRVAEEKKHAEEIMFLKKTNQQLKAQLEGIIAPKK
ncbi:33 kDa inner dynein arm light chain, axonemal [Nilaparvata lugens]|uniref:33 kDa inner dynein arm light chain, axonemal n=1 Tax=Nilaparvata lugens TaxID=108931 RepID=UPI00193E5330|nr:33 kDa inner dynein arm light chain, axonemal [Nilaparvata lugens]